MIRKTIRLTNDILRGINDPVCGVMDLISSVSSAIGILLREYTYYKKVYYIHTYTGSVTVCCRSIRFYCKHYGTYWGCTVAAATTVKKKLLK
jgi:hypothetical protein